MQNYPNILDPRLSAQLQSQILNRFMAPRSILCISYLFIRKLILKAVDIVRCDVIYFASFVFIILACTKNMRKKLSCLRQDF